MSMTQSRRRKRTIGRYNKTLKKQRAHMKRPRSRINKQTKRRINGRYKDYINYQKGGDEGVYNDYILKSTATANQGWTHLPSGKQSSNADNIIVRYRDFLELYQPNEEQTRFQDDVPSMKLGDFAALAGLSAAEVKGARYLYTHPTDGRSLFKILEDEHVNITHFDPKNLGGRPEKVSLFGRLKGVEKTPLLTGYAKKLVTEIIQECSFMEWIHEFLSVKQSKRGAPELTLNRYLGAGGMSVVFVVNEINEPGKEYVMKITRESVFDGGNDRRYQLNGVEVGGRYYSGDDIWARLETTMVREHYDKGSLIYEYIMTKVVSREGIPIQSTRETWGALTQLEVPLVGEVGEAVEAGEAEEIYPIYSAMIVEPLAKPGSLEKFVGSVPEIKFNADGSQTLKPVLPEINLTDKSRLNGTNVILRDMVTAIEHIESLKLYNPDIKLENIVFNGTLHPVQVESEPVPAAS